MAHLSLHTTAESRKVHLEFLYHNMPLARSFLGNVRFHSTANHHVIYIIFLCVQLTQCHNFGPQLGLLELGRTYCNNPKQSTYILKIICQPVSELRNFRTSIFQNKVYHENTIKFNV
jgi:hypothetical protein